MSVSVTTARLEEEEEEEEDRVVEDAGGGSSPNTRYGLMLMLLLLASDDGGGEAVASSDKDRNNSTMNKPITVKLNEAEVVLDRTAVVAELLPTKGRRRDHISFSVIVLLVLLLPRTIVVLFRS